ncbi:hypothetical protein EYF80_046972 [Liparis tanakae]|uniref:Uncharacterized protein n=1 Tax=Liparis tanakae TaxID=230148 RepID=A0A4Z2FR38_9TELE|nr:hypothetical protein EYF80_046972 [Liparis tanakae]
MFTATAHGLNTSARVDPLKPRGFAGSRASPRSAEAQGVEASTSKLYSLRISFLAPAAVDSSRTISSSPSRFGAANHDLRCFRIRGSSEGTERRSDLPSGDIQGGTDRHLGKRDEGRGMRAVGFNRLIFPPLPRREEDVWPGLGDNNKDCGTGSIPLKKTAIAMWRRTNTSHPRPRILLPAAFMVDLKPPRPRREALCVSEACGIQDEERGQRREERGERREERGEPRLNPRAVSLTFTLHLETGKEGPHEG